jgi:predicted small lipoprotein YifL
VRTALTFLVATSLLAGCGGKSEMGLPDASAAGSPDASTDGAAVTDAGLGEVDGCVDIVVSTYDESCQQDSDCIGITAREVCSGSCGCGGAVINVSGQARCEQAISGIVFAGCPCFIGPAPTCVQGTCALCGFGAGPPGCPDAGP